MEDLLKNAASIQPKTRSKQPDINNKLQINPGVELAKCKILPLEKIVPPESETKLIKRNTIEVAKEFIPQISQVRRMYRKSLNKSKFELPSHFIVYHSTTCGSLEPSSTDKLQLFPEDLAFFEYIINIQEDGIYKNKFFTLKTFSRILESMQYEEFMKNYIQLDEPACLNINYHLEKLQGDKATEEKLKKEEGLHLNIEEILNLLTAQFGIIDKEFGCMIYKHYLNRIKNTKYQSVVNKYRKAINEKTDLGKSGDKTMTTFIAREAEKRTSSRTNRKQNKRNYFLLNYIRYVVIQTKRIIRLCRQKEEIKMEHLLVNDSIAIEYIYKYFDTYKGENKERMLLYGMSKDIEDIQEQHVNKKKLVKEYIRTKAMKEFEDVDEFDSMESDELDLDIDMEIVEKEMREFEGMNEVNEDGKEIGEEMILENVKKLNKFFMKNI